MKQYIDKSMTFAEYKGLLDELFEKGLTTGPKQSEEMLGYARLNLQRMKRLEKTVTLNPKTIDALKNVNRKMIWLVITEGWCGDAAQNIPAIEKIAAKNINIETRYILRDENTELIDRFLTEGGRAIPKLISLDAETFEILGAWGARPFLAQDLYKEMKAQGLEKALMMENLQRLYNADKNLSIQSELIEVVKGWNGKIDAAAAAAI